ncbi:MAG TPA: TonB-dependent receptor [Caulobacterales bacterium]|nr:TonB-dependent receptor [Caulobacterales bacterium]
MKSGLLAKTSLGAFFAATLGFGFASAEAQEAARQSQDQTQAAHSGIEEVIVTATKRPENVQSVPFSVNAISGAQIESRHIEGLADLSRTAPEFRPVNTMPYRTFLSLRGVIDQSDAAGADHGVGVVIDDVPAIGNLDASLTQGFFDTDRVELLRGPQGTLFGRNVTGGVISLHSRAPESTPSASFTVGYGNYSAYVAQGYVTGAITDDLDGRLTFNLQGHDGMRRDVFLNRRSYEHDSASVRGQLRWRPSSDVTVLAGVEVSSLDGDETEPQLFGNAQPAASQASLLPVTSGPWGAAGVYPTLAYGATESNVGFPTSTSVDNDSAFLHVDWTVGSLGTVTSVSGYRSSEGEFFNPSDASPFGLFKSNLRVDESQYSEELRLASPSDQRLRYVIGAFVMSQNRKYEATTDVDCRAFAAYNPASPATAAAAPGLCVALTASDWRIGHGTPNYWPGEIQNQQIDQTSHALFAELNFDILSNLTATVGVRETWDRRSGHSEKTLLDQFVLANTGAALGTFLGYTGALSASAYNGVPCTANPSAVCATGGVSPIPTGVPVYAGDTSHGGGAVGASAILSNLNLTGGALVAARYRDDWNALTPRVSLSYHATPNVMFYTTASRGYLAGGFDQRGTSGAGLAQPFDPEFVWNYEAGVKSTFFDNRLLANLSLYQMDFKDKQVRTFIADCACTAVSNAATARSKGWELQLGAMPFDWLTLSASWAHTDARYGTFIQPPVPPSTTPTNFSGKRIPLVPEDSVSLSADAGWDLANDGGHVSLGATVEYSSRVWLGDANNDPAFLHDLTRKRGLLDLRAEWNSPDDRWAVALWGKNVTNEHVMQNWSNFNSFIFSGTGAPAGALIGAASWNEPATYGVRLTYRTN